jgi:hypothetical protein
MRANMGLEPSATALRQNQAEDLHQAPDLVDHLGPACLRAPKVARTRGLAMLFTWTLPSRAEIWAKPSASLVSLLLIYTGKARLRVTSIQAHYGSSRARSSRSG